MLDLLPLANAGTPLMWASCCALVFGNVAVGYLEAWLLKRLFKVNLAVVWLIAANYLSMLAGWGLVYWSEGLKNAAYEDPFSYAMPALCAAWVIAFVVTLIVEWPFYSLAAGKFGFRRNGTRPCLCVNTISYIGIVLIAICIGQTSAITQIHRISLQELQAPSGWVYYIDARAKEIRKIRTDGSKNQRVADLPTEALQQSPGWTRLTIEARHGKQSGSLFLRGRADKLIKSGVAVKGTFAVARQVEEDGVFFLGNITFGYGREATLSWIPDSKTRNGFWASEGLTVNGRRYAFETPLMSINWRSVTELPNGMIVANFGDQIVIFDPKRELAAVLVKGYGPAVALDIAPMLSVE